MNRRTLLKGAAASALFIPVAPAIIRPAKAALSLPQFTSAIGGGAPSELIVVATGASTTTFTTSPVNTTGATMLVAYVATNDAAASMSDNMGNTLTPNGAPHTTNGIYCLSFLTLGATTGTGHTFTVTSSTGFPSVCVAAFNVAGIENFNGGNTGQVNSGSYTNVDTNPFPPTHLTDISTAALACISFPTAPGTPVTADSGYTVIADIPTPPGFPLCVAWNLPNTLSNVNVTFSWPTAITDAVCRVGFLQWIIHMCCYEACF